MGLIYIMSLIVTAYLVGRYIEKKHCESLIRREKTYENMALITGEWKNHIEPDEEGQVFGSGIVIGADYFKSSVAALRSLFGGRLSTYESLLDRGRREALLRMQEKAHIYGAHKIINVRIETAIIGGGGGSKALPCVELFAYGTALRKIKSEISS